ncbi:Dps family protein [Pleionea mediterranea]|jgi:starvation-inducible DNA-binding protein|uniref:Starvation-inducible DNA-binding protein n=1 Tax=Pleionea mediterranea TaxID=523701 RepID=A0A316FL60_9GAMM|nr:DNA starvation/stationary phase protection protein [Pleionea mediterranea]PWK48470.1 starvation-inducible DNA-binding protein [Pleionea mediterranea]
MSKTKTAVLKSVSQESKMDIGVKRGDRKMLAMRLSEALADSYMLYLKTQNVHWNVMGPMFFSIHELTEKQYLDMADAIDDIAERIRAIGFTSPGTFTEFMNYSALEEDKKEMSAEQMIASLVEGNEMCARRIREAVAEAENCDDVMTAGLLTDRIGQHEQNAWMLRATIS